MNGPSPRPARQPASWLNHVRRLAFPTALAGRQLRSSLFSKYVGLFLAVVALALLTEGISQIWFSYREHRVSLARLQREQASAAAVKIGQFITEIETQVGWTLLRSWSEGAAMEERRFDAQRLLHQVPAITELVQLDPDGREQLRVSRLAMDVVGSQTDFSKMPGFREAIAQHVHYGPVYFRRGSEPYMTLSLAGNRRDSGVAVAEVNLTFIWDVISRIKVGERGRAYLVDSHGRLLAHPDISLVLRNTDLSHLPLVQAARGAASGVPSDAAQQGTDAAGRPVLAAYAPVTPPGWLVLIELPVEEANAPLVASIERSVLLLLAALLLALLAGVLLARKMIVPIQALGAGATRIGSGDLGHRIGIRTGDELEALGDQFNRMAAQLQDSYAMLERKVEERTHQLEAANLAKSRFIAAASHDLRQPLHALGLFVAELQSRLDSPQRDRLIERIDASLAAMNELFNALLDVSKLDAGVVTPDVADFPVAELLARIETTFAGAARAKGLSLRIMPSTAWVRSDFILLERILLNLVSNAVRYTARGGVLVGCRRRQAGLRIEVWDSGPGIPETERRNVFSEFYQVGTAQRGGGLGLGLAIVDRLCRLLAHPIELKSVVGKGSRFAVTAPLAAATRPAREPVSPPETERLAAGPRLIMVIDDDPLALDAMDDLLRTWGFAVVAAASERDAAAALAACGKTPDLVIADYHLAQGRTGIDAVETIRKSLQAPVPALLVSGDTAADHLRDVAAMGYHLLHKPVSPMALRATLAHFFRRTQTPAVA
jgi:signal transduction histidine kinase/CheY-like chemotaxis protein